jgi:hypothetical protein
LLGHYEGAAGEGSTITARSVSRPTDSWSPKGRRFPPPQHLVAPGGSRNLPFPPVTNPAAAPLRPQRHVPNSIATVHRMSQYHRAGQKRWPDLSITQSGRRTQSPFDTSATITGGLSAGSSDSDQLGIEETVGVIRMPGMRRILLLPSMRNGFARQQKFDRLRGELCLRGGEQGGIEDGLVIQSRMSQVASGLSRHASRHHSWHRSGSADRQLSHRTPRRGPKSPRVPDPIPALVRSSTHAGKSHRKDRLRGWAYRIRTSM